MSARRPLVKIAVDAMGGDWGPAVTVPAALTIVRELPDISVLLVGDPVAIESHLSGVKPTLLERIEVLGTTQVIAMDEVPARALRGYGDSSMRRMLELVRDKVAEACVSSGNTGALVALGYHLLGTLPGVDRPAIAARLPVARGNTYLLDLGANPNCSAERLQQFARLGSALVTVSHGIPRPRVRLLNIGTEANKGGEVLRLTAERLGTDSAVNYQGFIEGNQVFEDIAEVVVCDGFAGNIALKVLEGLALAVSANLTEVARSTPWRRLLRPLLRPLFRDLRHQLSPGRYNGAGLVGLNALVVKSHGGADANEFAQAMRRTSIEVRQGLLQKMLGQMKTLSPLL